MRNNPTIDDLEKKLKEIDLSTDYVDLLNQLSLELLKQDNSNQRTLMLAQKAVDICTTHFPDYLRGITNALITMGEYYRFQHNYSETLRLHLQAEAICLKSGSLDDLIRLRHAQSAVATMMSDWTRYITINLDLLEITQKAGQPRNEAVAYNSLAVVHEKLNNYEVAIRYREKAAEIAESIPDDAYYAFCLLGRSTPYCKLKEYDKAIHYAQSAYAFYEGANTPHEALNLGVLSDIYAEMGDYEQALHYIQRKFDLITAIKFEYFIPDTQCTLGRVYQQMGDKKLALHWLESGIALAEADNRKPILHHNYEYLAKAYKDHQDFEKAFLTLEKLMILQQDIHDTEMDAHRQTMLVIHETQQAQLDAAMQRQRAEAIKQQAEADRQYLEELNKLQNEAIHSLTHDLKNPLTAILMKSAKLQRLIDPQFHVHLFGIERQVMLMNELITDMLYIARLETGRALQLGLYSISTLIAQVIEENQAQASEKNIAVSFIRSEDYTFLFDDHYMKRAFNNLLSNAIKYSGEDTRIQIDILTTYEEVAITITDTGYGISPDDLPHIFERFYRGSHGNRDINGTGLGLSIVHSIIAQHGGQITVESTVGVGTTFRIYMPYNLPDDVPEMPARSA